MRNQDGIVWQDYSPDLNEACQALERRCPQGQGVRLSFERKDFLARSLSYGKFRMRVALFEGRVVATGAWAYKEIIWKGERRRAGFFYDGRVDPEFRGRYLAVQVLRDGGEDCRKNGVETLYSFCVADNPAVPPQMQKIGLFQTGFYYYLVWPVFRRFKVDPRVSLSYPEGREVFDFAQKANGPSEFQGLPYSDGILRGYRKSYRVDGPGGMAGCSIWSNEGILEERVISLPRIYGPMARVQSLPGIDRLPLPRIPRSGELLSSWYVYDFFAASAESTVELMKRVNAEAQACGVRFCYLVCPRLDLPWVRRLGAVLPRIFSPFVAYRLLSNLVPGEGVSPVLGVDPDIRDL